MSSISFNFSHKESGIFKDYRNLQIDQYTLNKVRCHTRCIGLLKFFGKIEDLPVDNGTKDVVHVNKGSLINKYREIAGNRNLSNDQIINLIRSSRQQYANSNLVESNKIEDEASIIPSRIGAFVKQENETLKRIQNGPLAGMAIRSGIVKGTENQHLRGIKIIDNLAASMKSILSQKTGKELHVFIENQFKTVCVLKENGSWVDPALGAMGAHLVPVEEDALQKCLDFVDAVTALAKKNPYLLSTIDNLDELQLEHFRQKATLHGAEMVEYLVPYAMALNGLTDAFVRDVDLFDRIDKTWTKEQKPHNIRKHLNLFGAIKYYTLNHLSSLKKTIKTGVISRDSNRNYLNLNILEAVVADLYMKNTSNAKAGWTLIQHPVGGKSNPSTGSGPATIGRTKGYPIIEVRADFPKKWADLYGVWNLAFCSISDSFPMLMTKLLIPKVNDYESNPEGYIYHRAMALYLYFQFSIFRGISGKDFSFLNGWYSQDVTHAFGEANAVSAQDYDESVKAQKRSSNHG